MPAYNPLISLRKNAAMGAHIPGNREFGITPRESLAGPETQLDRDVGAEVDAQRVQAVSGSSFASPTDYDNMKRALYKLRHGVERSPTREAPASPRKRDPWSGMR